MIFEIAQIDVKPGMEAAFETGVRRPRRSSSAPRAAPAWRCSARTRSRSATGWSCNGQTLENHTVDFRGSADFQEWRKLVGHCFAAPPEVEHVKEVVKGF